MIPTAPWLGPGSTSGLLIDTNLLVLYAVGTVNRNRIETFKRTRQYTQSDYELLIRVLDSFKPLYTLAHVLAEVSNLTDLPGPEKLRIRAILKQTISLLEEVEMPSARASEDSLYPRLGLVDAAISAVVRARHCAVLTDDFDLYTMLGRDRVPVLNFTHIRASNWGM